jgi:hypothetical protein
MTVEDDALTMEVPAPPQSRHLAAPVTNCGLSIAFLTGRRVFRSGKLGYPGPLGEVAEWLKAAPC